MTPFLGQFVEFSQIYNEKVPSLEQIGKYFRSINTSHLLQLLGKMNIVVWKTKGNIEDSKEFQEHLIKLLFSETDKKIIFELLNQNSKKKIRTLVFHRHQLLLAIKLTLLNPENKEGIKLDEAKVGLGKYLLAISEHLTPPESPITKGIPQHDFEYVRREITRLQYFGHDSYFPHSLPRSLTMWLNLPKTEEFVRMLEENSVSLDVEAEFLDEVGITIEEFITLGVANIIDLHRLDLHTDNPYEFMLQPKKLWSATQLPPAKQQIVAKFYGQDASDFSRTNELYIEQMLNGNDVFENNFLPLIYRPIININEDISIISDPQYLEEWIVSGVYWILLRRFRSNSVKANELSKYFGLLHQEYIRQILTTLCDEVIEIRRRDGVKTCDFVGLINKGDKCYLLFVESKKVALGLQTLLTGDKSQTIENLKKIFGEAGFGQVYSTIKHFEREELEELEHIPRGKILEIYPILVTDRFIIEESLNRNMYEKEFFDQHITQANLLLPQHIARPIFFSSEELEILEAAKQNEHEFDFLEFLQLRDNQLNDRTDRPLHSQYPGIIIQGLGEIVNNLDTIWHNLYLAGYSKHKNSKLKTVYSSFMKKLTRKLFPKKKKNK